MIIRKLTIGKHSKGYFMALLKEPLAIDFTVEPRMLTKEEKITIIEYIKEYNPKATKKADNKREVGRAMPMKDL